MKKSFLTWLKTLIEISLLLITNGIANFLFIRHYTYYSDDWSDVVISPDATRSYLSVLSDCQRPIQFALKKLAFSFHGGDAFTLQLAGLVLSSLFLVLLYFVIKKIAAEFGYLSFLPFVSCLLYAVLWNKDEAYPWIIVSICNEVGFIFYAASILCYLYLDRRRYLLPLSLVFYFLGLLTYETGFALPAVFLVYDLLKGQKFRYSFYFLLPLGLVMLIRTTQWFGLGYVRYGHDVSSFEPGIILLHTGLFIFTSLLIFSNQVQFAVMGWLQVTPVQGTTILACDLLLILLISWYLRSYRSVERGSLRYLAVLLTGLVVTSVPIILTTGGTATRGYVLIDIFVACLVAYICVRLCSGKHAKIIFTVGIFCSLLICQGLYVNWVASGEFTDTLAGYVCSHSDEIESPYVYFNSSDFVKNAPNGLSSAYHPTREDLFRFRSDVIGNRFDELISRVGKEDLMNRSDTGYVQYYNAKCLDQWAFDAMLRSCGLHNVTLIYGGNWYGNFPTYIGDDEIKYQQYADYHPTGPEKTIPRSQVFEITYSRVFGTGQKQPLTLF